MVISVPTGENSDVIRYIRIDPSVVKWEAPQDWSADQKESDSMCPVRKNARSANEQSIRQSSVYSKA